MKVVICLKRRGCKEQADLVVNRNDLLSQSVTMDVLQRALILNKEGKNDELEKLLPRIFGEKFLKVINEADKVDHVVVCADEKKHLAFYDELLANLQVKGKYESKWGESC